MKRNGEIKAEIEDRVVKLERNYTKAYDYFKIKYENHYEFEEIRGKSISDYLKQTYELGKTDYYLKEFAQWLFGKSITLGENDYTVIDGRRMQYCIFKDCEFKYIIFKNCSFAGCKFENVKFDHAIFDDCIFSTPVIEDDKIDVNNIYYAPTIFEKCAITSSTFNGDMDYVLFQKDTMIIMSKFQNCSLQHTVMDKCFIKSIKISACDLSDFAVGNANILDISFTNETKIFLNENTLVDCSIDNLDPNIEMNAVIYKEKSMTIRKFSRIFTDNGYSTFGGEYLFRAKNIERKGLRGIRRVVSQMNFFLNGYGERPSYTFGWILVLTIIFGFMYMYNGIEMDGAVINYCFKGFTHPIKFFSDYRECLFFSITTFSTVGYGDYVVGSPISMFIAELQMFVSVALCAIWTGTILHKTYR